jgi:hypothetical protein
MLRSMPCLQVLSNFRVVRDIIDCVHHSAGRTDGLSEESANLADQRYDSK